MKRPIVPGDMVTLHQAHGDEMSSMTRNLGWLCDENPAVRMVPDGEVCLVIATHVSDVGGELLILWDGAFGWIGMRNATKEDE